MYDDGLFHAISPNKRLKRRDIACQSIWRERILQGRLMQYFEPDGNWRFTRLILRAIAVLGVKAKRFASRATAISRDSLSSPSNGSRALTPPRGDGFLAIKTFC
jgi:hypothetical protein